MEQPENRQVFLGMRASILLSSLEAASSCTGLCWNHQTDPLPLDLPISGCSGVTVQAPSISTSSRMLKGPLHEAATAMAHLNLGTVAITSGTFGSCERSLGFQSVLLPDLLRAR